MFQDEPFWHLPSDHDGDASQNEVSASAMASTVEGVYFDDLARKDGDDSYRTEQQTDEAGEGGGDDHAPEDSE